MKKKILLVDDMQSVRAALRLHLCPPIGADALLRQLLEKGAMDPTPQMLIHEADQGETGVRMAREALQAQAPYDIIFMDMMMPPGISGDEAILQIREFDKQVEIIVCTAMTTATEEDLTQANAGELPVIISKPLTHTSNLRELVANSGRKPRGRAALKEGGV